MALFTDMQRPENYTVLRDKEELKKFTWNKTSEETINFIMETLKRYNDV